MGQEIVNYSEEWAKHAADYATQEQPGGGLFLTTKGGVLKFGDEELPGNQACVVILDSVFENTYYREKFDAENVVPPVCYAFGRAATEMAPHESMQASEYFEPQSEDCQSCPHNVWGSSDRGRGKACQNRRRLALLNAGWYVPKPRSRDFDLELIDDPKHFATADIAFVKVPVTSGRIWAKYFLQLQTEHRRPPYGAITRLYLEPDANDQYHMCFELLELMPDALYTTITARHEEAMQAIARGYAPPEECESLQAGSLKGLRRR